ncbi:myb-like protein X isoform X2 [Onthophagus taurus]|uniref:myb-like protein X isoform X2 n=1 Tax=Onthophagus taurus TaxID=166361 RepID=UPI000C2093A5|nr:histone-lysine N-methyltransferase 2E isoform X2 [Onthophagus taurus]
MSVCLETTKVLTTPAVTLNTTSSELAENEKPQVSSKNISKIFVANPQQGTVTSTTQMKIVNSPLLTMVNTGQGPITVVKSSLANSSATSHITLVNSTTLKSTPTITLVNAAPITVVKAVQPTIHSGVINSDNNKIETVNNGTVQPLTEKATLHNVFVKKNHPVGEQDVVVPQSHKLLTANSFPSTNVMQSNSGQLLKTVNGQRPVTGNKVKILSNVIMPNAMAAGPSNVLLNKNTNQRIFQQKPVGNGATKYLNKPIANVSNKQVLQKPISDKPQQQKIIYAGPKSQIKTLSTFNYAPNKPNLKALSPPMKQNALPKPGPSRQIPPQQRQQRHVPGKPNYIGKHAVQAQKLKQPLPKKKATPFIHQYQNRPTTTNQVTFNQALTAQILETLEPRPHQQETRQIEYKPQSNLDTLSFVCQAVLLDHNYNATLPMDSPVPPSPNPSTPNGVGMSLYSPGSSKKRLFNLTPTNQSLTSLSSASLLQSTVSQDDDAASDISCVSDRKPDTEGEETDTAPEAEAVANDNDQFDRYGDYVTRCICGFIHDDGYMIECDQCKVWQHVRCVVKTKKVPDDYLCEVCDPSKPTDRHKARTLQQQWMREVQERDAKLRKEQLKEVLTDSDSSDGDHPSINNNITLGKNRRKVDIKQRQRREREKRQLKRKITKRKMRSQCKTGSGDDEKTHLPQLRQWIDNYEEAVTNHYSPELRARISNIRINGAHSEFSGQVDPQVQRCKLETNSNGTKCLLTTLDLDAGTPIIELRGKYMLSTQHRTSTNVNNLTTRQQRPGPFLFFYRLNRDNTEVCVDTRTYGNVARFVRRSCQPNAELRHCIEKGVLHLYIVTASAVEKDVELTIKHESHDLVAAVNTTAEVSCACGNPETCALKSQSRKNGIQVPGEVNLHRKRRGRRTSSTVNSDTIKVKEEPPPSLPPEKEENVVEEKIDVKKIEVIKKVEVKKEEIEIEEVKIEEIKIKEEIKEEETTTMVEASSPPPPPPPPPVVNRRSSAKSDHEDRKESPAQSDEKDKKKLSREERKFQAIMKAIERMEKQEQRKQEHQAKQANRRESEPLPGGKDEEKNLGRGKRRKRKGRTRTLSTNSQQGRRNRLNSADSAHATSSDETLLSPNDQNIDQSSPRKAAGLLLAFSNGDGLNETKSCSPEQVGDIDSNSNSSPETPLSSACLLVAAAVEPLEPGFKFPKTKKGLMNEWLNKGTEQPPTVISPSLSITPTESVYDTATGFYTPTKNLVALAQAATTFCDNDTQPRVNAKKRWLRQAISEDQCDSPSSSRPESPPISSETLAPPKKRRLPRESLSTESMVSKGDEDDVNNVNQESSETVEPEFTEQINTQPTQPLLTARFESSQEFVRKEFSLLDPRLCRDRQNPLFNSEHLVGTVEKTLSFLGFQDNKKPEAIPTKRKLSITEYRQRKKLNVNDKQDEGIIEEMAAESQSPKMLRNRSNSSSSTSCPTSDEEVSPPSNPPQKILSAFNSEPTELERQRENVSLRLKKALGLTLDVETRKSASINVETILKRDLPSPPKPNLILPLSSPTFPIPGSGDVSNELPPLQTPPPQQQIQNQSMQFQQIQQQKVIQEVDDCAVSEIPLEQPSETTITVAEGDEEMLEETLSDTIRSSEPPVLYYTPDEEEMEMTVTESDGIDDTDGGSASYVPPFNNPLYPNSNYTNYGSVIDDDAPYEGRNPSPPPNHGEDVH